MPAIIYSQSMGVEQLTSLQHRLATLDPFRRLDGHGEAEQPPPKGAPSAAQLLSSSVRTPAPPPRFIHGNPPLYHSRGTALTNSNDDESRSSPGQFDDAEGDRLQDLPSPPPSPPSASLYDQLRSAARAVEELKEAVKRQRQKRHSLANAPGERVWEEKAAVKADRAASEGTTSLHRRVTDLTCLEPGDSQMRVCPPSGSGIGIGLGIGIPMKAFPSDTSSMQQYGNPSQGQAVAMTASPSPSLPLLIRRNGNEADCTTTARPWKPSLSATKHLYSSQSIASPTLYASAPSTPLLENSTPSTPVLARATSALATSSSNETTQWMQQQATQTNTAQSSSHHSHNTLAAVVCASTAGSLLLLAALVFLLLLRKRRSRREKKHLEAILDKVAPPPTPSDGKEGDHGGMDGGGGAVGSVDYFGADPHRQLPTISTSPEELRVVSPWSSYDMAGHPFAIATRQADRFSPDLAHSGLVGHEPSRDNSFTWILPKLSVPPAAARAMVKSHYVKKRVAVPTRSQSTPRMGSVDDEKEATVSSLRDWSESHNMSTAASSECIDPQIDHRRRSFTVLERESTMNTSSSWIKSTFKRLATQPRLVDDTGCSLSSPASLSTPSMSSGRSTVSQSSDSHFFDISDSHSCSQTRRDKFAITQAAVQQVLEIRLPSLSIANSAIVDLADCSRQVSPRLAALKWGMSEDRSSRAAKRELVAQMTGLSSGSTKGSRDVSRAVAPVKAAREARRVSWAGPLESCRESSRESMADAQPLPQQHRAYQRASSIPANKCLVKRMVNWTLEATDTEDELREGYDAEQEIDTEVETEGMAVAPPLTPVITLTSSEEEGRFERRISLTSARDACSDAQHGAGKTDREGTEDREESSESESSDRTVIIHGSSEEDEPCHLDALDCLLADDFPTIPEWTPFQSVLGSR